MKIRFSVVASLPGFLISLGANAAFGDIDTGFNPFVGGCEAIEAREDGGSYVDVRPSGFSLSAQAPVARLDARGQLVTSWGTNGLALSGLAQIQQILRGSRGDLFVVDGASVSHIDASGRIDGAFGSGGKALIGNIRGASLQSDGKFVALVQRGDGYGFARLTPSGGFDQTFGSGGELQVPGSSTAREVYGWAVRGDGGVELGTYGSDTFAQFVPPSLAVVLPDLSSTVAAGRLVPQGIATWMSSLAKADPMGALVLAGGTGAQLRRFDASGSLDTSFGGSGVVDFSARRIDILISLWREPSGGWIVVGATFVGMAFVVDQQRMRAIRFSADGFPDNGFGEQLISADGHHPVAHAPDGSILHAEADCSLRRVFSDGPREETTVVEYYHPLLGHYFMTSSANEIADLDSNVQPGWIRTGESFGAWSPGDLPGAAHVCRFYGDPVIGPNSHFYTGEDFECDFLIRLDAATPKGVGAWHLEARPFDIAIPSNFMCPDNLQPVYRVFNGIVGTVNGPNHRYATDPAVYAAMQAKGWLPEGAHFCAPPRFN